MPARPPQGRGIDEWPGRIASLLPSVRWHRASALSRLVTRYSLPAPPGDDTRTAGRRLNGSAAVLAFSVLADSAVEHYRGSFQNRAMYTPLVAAALTLGAACSASADAAGQRARVARRDLCLGRGHRLRRYWVFISTISSSAPAAWSWLNLFYAAPIGAPMALALAGLLGRGAERVRDTPPGDARHGARHSGRPHAGRGHRRRPCRHGRRSGLLHFRGAFHDPGDVAAGHRSAGRRGACSAQPRCGRAARDRFARWWLRMTARLASPASASTPSASSRNMGGWRNWSQNLLNGPPLPAPPSFTGLALAGLAALR